MAPLMNSMMPSSSSLTRKNIERDLKAPVIASISFFILHNCMQKLAGLLSIHSGRNPLLKLTYGFVSFSCCSVASYMAAKELSSSITNKYKIPFVSENIQKPWTNNKNKRELIRKFYVGLGLFLLIEGKAFHTALPSNILSIGVFANTKLGSVPATSDVATELQRRTIQTLGHTYGCHQCGNRQMISRVKLFIADHQPPTKIAIQIRESFLSRLTNFKSPQRLFPQCNKCFLMQGSAVRQMMSKMVYHFSPQAYHLVPAISILLCNSPVVKEWTDDLVDYSEESSKNLPKKLRKVYKDTFQ